MSSERLTSVADLDQIEPAILYQDPDPYFKKNRRIQINGSEARSQKNKPLIFFQALIISTNSKIQKRKKKFIKAEI